MRFELGLSLDRRDAESVVTVGTFDGVHRGHQAIIRNLNECARKSGGISTLVTFDPHPGDVVRNQTTPLLTTVSEKAEILESLGLGRLVVIPFTRSFAELSAEAFIEDVLIRQVGLQRFIAGYDHGFGRGRKGDIELLRNLAAHHGFAVDVIGAQEVRARVVSSRMVRDLLRKQGDVQMAGDLLGRPYKLTGMVVEGQRRGRQLGFPTANLAVENPQKLIPKSGVYAVRACANERWQGGMMNIGVRPTVDQSSRVHLEVHLLDFSENLYGHALKVEFAARIRDEIRFESLEALAAQLERDEAICRPLVT